MDEISRYAFARGAAGQGTISGFPQYVGNSPATIVAAILTSDHRMDFQDDGTFFARLISPMLDQLHRIARTTHGEYSVDELKNEAWIAAIDYRGQQHFDVEPDDEHLQKTVILGLWRAFGKFANRTLRSALRLDTEAIGEDGESAINAVAATLAAPECYEPEKVFERTQEQAENSRYVAERFTEAIAWLRVLDQFEHNIPSIARYLAISTRTLDNRLKYAQQQAASQPSIFDGVTAIPHDFRPKRGMSRSRGFAPPSARRICTHLRPWQAHLFFAFGAVFHQR